MQRSSRWLGAFAPTVALLRGTSIIGHLHDGNQEHGGVYNMHDKRCRDDELDDFLRSVKGWTIDEATGAISKTYKFDEMRTAYNFMGRLYAFCWNVDKFPLITWKGCEVETVLFSPKFKGLTKREVRVAAFMNDQSNLLNRAVKQRKRLEQTVVTTSYMAEQMRQIEQANLEADLQDEATWQRAKQQVGAEEADERTPVS